MAYQNKRGAGLPSSEPFARERRKFCKPMGSKRRSSEGCVSVQIVDKFEVRGGGFRVRNADGDHWKHNTLQDGGIDGADFRVNCL
jgi:hypothetical protein